MECAEHNGTIRSGVGMTAHQEHNGAWWRGAVAYQVYVRSFRDSNGDGIGDLPGVTQSLDDLAKLGVNAIWLNPCYLSPQHDHGYDIADYRQILPDYGTLADFDQLVAHAHTRDIRVLMDIVPNHCSSEHQWFIDAISAGPGSPERDRFIFADGEGDGSQPPNDWPSVFGGSAWDRLDDGTENPQWYLHLFDSTQPDFNWRNQDVRTEFLDILRFWFDRGVDGFRIDVAHGMVKSLPIPRGTHADQSGLWTQPELFEIYSQWRQLAESYDPPKYFVGEAWVNDPEVFTRFTAPGHLQQSFAFDLLVQPWFAYRLRRSIEQSFAVAGQEDGPAWALANHDVHRLVTRLGQERIDKDPDPFDMLADARRDTPVNTALGKRRARAATALLFALPGTVYVYQGEELGLPEVLDLPDWARQDPMWIRTNGQQRGRDGCRVPLPWKKCGSSMGFGPDGASAPWLPQPEEFRAWARDEQGEDPTSMLSLYMRLGGLRRQLVGSAHRVHWADQVPEEVLAFSAGRLFCATNTGGEDVEVQVPQGAQILLNTAVADCDVHLLDNGMSLADGTDFDSRTWCLPADSTSWWSLNGGADTE